MKKIFALLLILMLAFSLVACGDGEGDDTTNGNNQALDYSQVGANGSAQLPGYGNLINGDGVTDLPLMPLDPDANLG
ncbi:MAG: hypothetical protein J6Q69_02635 [Clostridia bacterium]|nr:hypothetical protein [Clostridia bacterium]